MTNVFQPLLMVWVMGEPVTFTGWSPGNPDNLQSNDEDFAALGLGPNALISQGNDFQSGNAGHAPFFVEYEAVATVPEPASLLVWGSLAITAGLSVRARRFFRLSVG